MNKLSKSTNKINLTEYVDRLYAAAIRKTGDTHVAEDIVQETFLAAIQELSRGREPDDLWAWLLRVMSNKYCDWLREKYNKPVISFEEYPFDIPAEEKEDEETEEKLEAIRRELGFLARTHREVMVRFYMHGDSLEKIARDLEIPVGTVKSRLNIGRQHVREGVKNMENYTKQSYEPETLHIGCSGATGVNREPFSLVEPKDKLAQNILILAYSQPMTEAELAKQLGVPAPFIEPVVEKLVDGELMQRMAGGKVYTDFIIYTQKDRMIPLGRQLEAAEKHFESFWGVMEEALQKLRQRDYHSRQTEHGKVKLELHFAICLMTEFINHVRQRTIDEYMPYSEYPYRKNGGRWFALGSQLHEGEWEKEQEYKEYQASGEFGTYVSNFYTARGLALRGYDTVLGTLPNDWHGHNAGERLKWFYEILKKVPVEESMVANKELLQVEDYIHHGVLKKETGLELDIPVMSFAEYDEEKQICASFVEKLDGKAGAVVEELLEAGAVKLPAHLKGIPKWQQYMCCTSSLEMAVIRKAKEKGRFLEGISYPVPASLLLVDEEA